MRRWATALVLATAGGFLLLSLWGRAGAQGSCSTYKVFSTGGSVTAGDMNSIQTTLTQTNMIPACMDDYSANATQMNATTDPNNAGAQSAATTLAGELERLRYVLRHVTGFSQWWTHFEDLNFADRGLRLHRTLATTFHTWLRIEGHTASAATRFHLVSLSIPGYTAGTMHPESALFLIHVGTTVRFMVGPGGDTHVGGTLGVHAAGLSHAPALFNLQYPQTGFFWPARDHLGVTVDNMEVARFHGAGLVLAPHAALTFRHASGSLHVSAVSLAAGSQVQLGDPNVATTMRGAGLTAGADRLVGFNASNTGLEAKQLSGSAGLLVTHQASGLALHFQGVRVLQTHLTAVGTGANTNETDLFRFTIPANTLGQDGQALRVTIAVTTATNANTKTMRVYAGNAAGGPVLLLTSGAIALNNGSWMGTLTFVRTGASAQLSTGRQSVNDSTILGAASSFVSSTALSFSSAIDLTLTGQNGAASASDVSARFWIVEFLPAPT